MTKEEKIREHIAKIESKVMKVINNRPVTMARILYSTPINKLTLEEQKLHKKWLALYDQLKDLIIPPERSRTLMFSVEDGGSGRKGLATSLIALSATDYLDDAQGTSKTINSGSVPSAENFFFHKGFNIVRGLWFRVARMDSGQFIKKLKKPETALRWKDLRENGYGPQYKSISGDA